MCVWEREPDKHAKCINTNGLVETFSLWSLPLPLSVFAIAVTYIVMPCSEFARTHDCIRTQNELLEYRVCVCGGVYFWCVLNGKNISACRLQSIRSWNCNSIFWFIASSIWTSLAINYLAMRSLIYITRMSLLRSECAFNSTKNTCLEKQLWRWLAGCA